MNRYVFDLNMLRYLKNILGETQKSICESYGGDEATFIYRMSKGSITLVDLVSLCNHYHIPISWFIKPAGKEIDKRELPTRADVVHVGRWKNIESKWEWFGMSFSMHNGTSHKESAKACKIAMSNYYNLWINKEHRWQKTLIKDFLKIINNSRIYPGCVVVDGNKQIDVLDSFYNMIIREREINIMEEHFHRREALLNEELLAMKARNDRLMDRIRQQNEELGNMYLNKVAEDEYGK